MRLRQLAAVGALATLVLVAGGCAIADDGSPRAIDRSAVPIELLSPDPPTTTTLPPDVPKVSRIIYLANEEKRLVLPVDRDVQKPANLSQVLRQLIDARPSADEAAKGLSTLISRRTKLIEVRTAGGVDGSLHVTINLDQFFPGLSSDDVSLAVAQVVYTVQEELRTERNVAQPVTVEFQVRGQKKDIRAGDGQTMPSVTTDDFAGYLADKGSGVSPSTSEAPADVPQPPVPSSTAKG